MKIITWNVNSVRTRLERILALLERHEPDALCIQETKVTREAFPIEAVKEAGYLPFVHGQKTYNGVAILVRSEGLGEGRRSQEVLEESLVRGFFGDPIPEQARVISLKLEGLRLVNAYVVNGKAVGHDYYDLKLRWLQALGAWLQAEHQPTDDVLVCGDFNIAPDDVDVHDPERWEGKVLCSEKERSRLRELLDWGLFDLHRAHAPDEQVFTWWDYRAGAFPRGWGLRIDLFLGTQSLRDRVESVWVDREERKKTTGPGKPSDHAPVILTLRD